MMVLITYDVNTETPEGKTRLRKVAKVCVNYGQRVQNSVFECLLSPLDLKKVRLQIEDIVDKSTDSVRYYFLGDNWIKRVEQYGKQTSYNPETPLII
jgi:CRISPR-associated protein Cas2